MLIMNSSAEIISLIEKIKDDRTHGASQLARQAVGVLKIASYLYTWASVSLSMGTVW